MIALKRLESSAALAPNSAGVSGSASPPMARIRSFTAWVPRMRLISRLRRVTTSAGVPAGA